MTWIFHPIFPSLFFAALAVFLGGAQSEVSAKKYLNPPPEQIEYFHFGFRESLADSLWLRWIQDNDVCQTYLAPMKVLVEKEIDTAGYEVVVPRYKVCDNSWSFKMLDAITRLSPKFNMPYIAGASTLAILVEDYEGATVMYERGLKEYPKDWQLLYRAAFHYQYNLKNPTKAAELLIQVADNGGPYWTRSLAARMLTLAGQLELSISVLETYRKSVEVDNEPARQEIDRRIAKLKAQLEAQKK